MLEAAVAALLARGTEVIAFGEHHLYNGFAHVHQFGCINLYLESIVDFLGTGRCILAVDFTGTGAAGA
jgi:hypothetical protein